MQNELTPTVVKERALSAHHTLNRFLQKADVSRSTFWRWAKSEQEGDLRYLHPVIMRKIEDALAKIEAERA